jgi:hypothetical protein
MTTRNRTLENPHVDADTTTSLGPLAALRDRASALLCAAFDTAMKAASHAKRVTNEDVAQACDVSEKSVRLARGADGEHKPLAAVREMFLPRDVFYALQRAKESAYEQLHRPALVGCEATQARVAMGAALRFLDGLNEALLDGTITDDEIPELLRRLDDNEEHQRKLRQSLHARLFASIERKRPS